MHTHDTCALSMCSHISIADRQKGDIACTAAAAFQAGSATVPPSIQLSAGQMQATTCMCGRKGTKKWASAAQCRAKCGLRSAAHRPRSSKQGGALTLVPLLMSAPAATSSLTTAMWPSELAQCKGVHPSCGAACTNRHVRGECAVISKEAMHTRTSSKGGWGGASQPKTAGSQCRRSQLAQPAWTSVTASADHHPQSIWDAQCAGEASKGHACAPLPPLQSPPWCTNPAEC